MPEMTLEEARAALGLPQPREVPFAVPPAPPPVPPSPGGLVVVVRPEAAAAPPVGPEAVGTPGATTAAVAPTLAAPPITPQVPTGPKPSEGMADLDVMMQGVWQTESGNRQVDPKTGKIVTSNAGALGVSQLLPSTAAALGVDPHDEAQNREGGKRYLAEQFQKYGNWRDALGAYFAGPGGYDKWLAAGAPRDTKLGKQITTYQDTVMARAGVARDDAGTTPGPDGTRQVGLEAARAVLNNLPAQTDAEKEHRRLRDEGAGFLETAAERGKAVAYSLYKGARDFEVGPMQALLEQTSPDTAKWMTQRLNEADNQWAPLTKRFPLASGVGELAGGTAAFLAAARLLGPPVAAGLKAAGAPAVMKALAPRIPWLVQQTGRLTTAGRYAASVPIGAAVTAGTSFNPSARASDRISEAFIGGLFGPLGVAMAHGITKAMQGAASRGEQTRLMDALKQNADILSKDLNYLKDVAVSRVGKLEATARSKYPTGGATGVEYEPVSGVIRDYKTKAPSQIDTTKNALRREMGLTTREAKAAEAQVLEEQYQLHVQAVKKAQDAWLDKFVGKHEGVREARRGAMMNDPTFPQVTMQRPPPYVPEPLTAEEFMKGRQLLNREIRASRSNTTKFGQLQGLRKELEAELAAQARASGMTTTQFYQQLLRADNFYKSQLAPAHDVMGTLLGQRFRGASRVADDAVNQLTAGADPTKLFDKVVKTIETGTQREVDALLHVFGSTPADKERLVRSLAFRALTKAEGGIGKDFDPQAVAKYINENHTNLRRVLTSEQYEWMKGFAKITEEVAAQAGKGGHGRRFGWGSNFLLIVGAEHALRGDVLHGIELAASGFVAHALFNAVPALRALPLGRLVRNAADLEPGSKALERLVSQVQVQYMKRAIASGRFLGEKVQGQGGPSFVPMQPMPQQAPQQQPPAQAPR